MSEVFSKVIKQVSIPVELLLHGFTDIVDAETIFDKFNKAAIPACCKYFVRSKLNFEFGFTAKDLIHLADQLHGKLFQSEVVARFHNESHHIPSQQMPIFGLLLQPLILFVA